MEYLARVNPLYLAAVTCFAAKADVRYYLNGICITPHHERGVMIVATNGHLIGAIHDPDGWVSEEIIVSTPTAAIMKACKYRGTTGRLEKVGRKTVRKGGKPAAAQAWIGADRIIITDTFVTEPPPVAFGPHVIAQDVSSIRDGKFPDWRRVFSTAPGEHDATIMPRLNVDVLQPFCEAARILKPSKLIGTAIDIVAQGPNAITHVYMSHPDLSDRFFGGLMPMRREKDEVYRRPMPTFITERPAPKPAAKPRCRMIDGVATLVTP